MEITGWLVGLFPTLCPNKGLSEKLSTAFALENRCLSTGQGIIRLSYKLPQLFIPVLLIPARNAMMIISYQGFLDSHFPTELPKENAQNVLAT